ncbi:U5 small nuclear ribonucleoprotein TSSC4 [Eurosta solidaginis]|uniref:U5 small nuclear ribonucleoprotein TSSC4 n=1 Tax=Eurosta solidaginis TaxID=178769 RepID=UPI0035312E75
MQDFEAKRNALFACLDDASKELTGTALDQSQKTSPTIGLVYRQGTCPNRKLGNLSPNKTLSRMRGKESIFKKPDMPLARCLKPRRIPDFKANPQKWTKYSLADVDISDHTNTAAAFQFLKQMDDQHEARAAAGEDNTSANNLKIEFKKSSKLTRKMKAKEGDELKDAEVDKPRLKGSKVVMPEYVVGQQKESKKRRKIVTENQVRAAGILKLDHLQEEDDVEEEEG